VPVVEDLVKVYKVHGDLLYEFLLELVLILLHLYYRQSLTLGVLGDEAHMFLLLVLDKAEYYASHL
jgi:hypothetical protein